MEPEPLRLLPPHPSLCQQCARDHPPEEPHDRESLFYQMWFMLTHGRWPTWADACAHTDPERQRLWREELEAMGAKWDP